MYSNTSYHQGPFEQTVGALLDLEMSDLGGRFDISQYLSDREKNDADNFICNKTCVLILHAIFPVQMLSWSVEHKVTFCFQYISTDVTWIAECVWKVLRLHMIPSKGDHFMWKLFTNCAVEPLVFRVPSYKLKQLTGVLKSLSWQREFNSKIIKKQNKIQPILEPKD